MAEGIALPARIGSLIRSPALLSALVFAAGGVGFAAGNILLARVLPEDEYGRVSLFLALTQLGIVIGPLGVETVINRHHLGPSGAILWRVGLTTAVAGVLLAVGAAAFYDIGTQLAAILAITVLAAGVNRVAGAFFQSRRKFGFSLFIILIHNWIVLCAVPVVLLFDRREALPAALTVACGYFAMALLGWTKGFAARNAQCARGERAALLMCSPSAPSGAMFREGLPVVGVQLAVAALFQLDRLLIPHALSIRDLATYSVVSAVAASPFRMLQTGFSFALLPRLRACESRAAITRLLRHEASIALAVVVAVGAAVLLLTPWVLGYLLESRYAFPASLLHALIVVGVVRVWCGIAGATAAALGSARELAILNLYGWIALVVAAVCALTAKGAGLTGIVYGLGAGWLALAVAATAIGARAVAARGATSGRPR